MEGVPLLKITAMSKVAFQAIVFFVFLFLHFSRRGHEERIQLQLYYIRTGKWEDKGSTPVGRTRKFFSEYACVTDYHGSILEIF